MKRNIIVMIALALSTTIVAGYLISCGGGGGGGTSGSGGGGPAAVAVGTFTKNVFHTGSPPTAEDQFSMSAGSRYQSLYLARDMKGAGKITSISYKYEFNDVVTAVSCPNVTMKMGHSQVNTLSSTFANNVNNGGGSLQTVISSSPVTIPAGSKGSYYTINLATPFYYNGVDNLVVEVSRGAACTSEVGTAANVTNPVYNGIMRSNQSSTAAAGTTNNVVLDTVFTFSGGDSAVEFVPFFGATDGSFCISRRTQFLYLANEINGSGPITGIGMKTAATTTTGTYTYTLRLGHTTLSQLTEGGIFANNYNSGPSVTVVSNGLFTIPGGVPDGTYIWIPFLSTFTYNGSDNLIVDLDVSSVKGVNLIRFTDYMGAIRHISGDSGSNTANYGYGYGVYHVKFRFNGGTMDVIGANDGPGNVGVFGIDAGSIQFLLHASELGTAGTIDKLACRLTTQSLPSIAATFQSFTVTLAHTSKKALAAPYAANIAGGTKVYDGPFAMPAGLLGGDWVEIPFTTAFNYDGTSNLVVQTTTAGGPQPYTCQLSVDATRFAGRYMDTMGGPYAFRGNFRIWINK